MSIDLKREFLNLLERDIEFRYTVAGYLGLSEILKKLDLIAEEQSKLWGEVKALREGQNKIWEEIRSLREEQNKLWEEVKALREGQNKLWEEIKALREDQNKLWENQNRLWENQNKLWEEVRALRLEQEKLLKGQEALWIEVRRIRTTLERLAISEEEEAWDVISYRLKGLGLDVKLDRLLIEDFEMNIYGVSDDICILGEVTMRLEHTLIDELERKINFLREKKPEILKPKLIKAIYTTTATPKAIEKAKEYGIWIVTARQEYTPLKIHET